MPPAIDELVFDSVQPTVTGRLAIHFAGRVYGRFEQTSLGSVRKVLGVGNVQHQGEAGGSIYWLCYSGERRRLWVVSGGEIGGPNRVVTEVVEEVSEEDIAPLVECPILPQKFSPVVLDGKLRLGVSRREIMTVWGRSSKSDAAQMVYSHHKKLAADFEVTAWLVLRFREDKLVSMRGLKTTTN